MKILVAEKPHDSLIQNLTQIGHECVIAYKDSKEEIEEQISDFEGIIIRSRFIIDTGFLQKAVKLKFIARAGSGLENIDCKTAKKMGVICINAAEGNKQAVAEHTLGMLLNLFNKLNKSDREVRNGIWNRESNRGTELSGKTIGIIGFGNNGSAFAEILKGFNVKILAFDKYLENYAYKSNMKTIYKEADIISLHIPINKETKYLVDENFIKNCKKNIYLINTSRGKCVNTKDLTANLESGKILGACLDVLEYEKSSFEELAEGKHVNELNYLIKSEKTVLSPHIAGWTIESKKKIAQVLFRKISNI